MKTARVLFDIDGEQHEVVFDQLKEIKLPALSVDPQDLASPEVFAAKFLSGEATICLTGKLRLVS